jgi:hypothetical protein
MSDQQEPIIRYNDHSQEDGSNTDSGISSEERVSGVAPQLSSGVASAADQRFSGVASAADQRFSGVVSAAD